MTPNQQARQFRLLTVHGVLSAFAMSLVNGFIGAYLLRLGFSIAATTTLFAATLALRFVMRAAMLPLVRAIGMRPAFLLGRAIMALQFLPLMRADQPAWLAVWVLIVSVGECLYFPIYHAANATAGGNGRRGRQIAARQIASTGLSVTGPIAGGLLLTHFGPGIEFVAAVAMGLGCALPLMWMQPIKLGRVPSIWQSLRMTDKIGLCAFAADGWIASGLAIAWPMILFSTLGSSYDALGWAGSAAAMAGAVAGLGCGMAIDKGDRHVLYRAVTIAMLLGVALRVASGWAPWTAFAANATGAAITGIYYPVLMSMVYDRAKRSGSAYQFHLAAESGWDAGAILGCLATAAVASSGLPLSLAVVPSCAGILLFHYCIRAEARMAQRGILAQNA